jgi:hypothetical protein
MFPSSFLEPPSKKTSQITKKTRKSTSQPSTTISTVYPPQTSTIYSQARNATTPTTLIPQTNATFILPTTNATTPTTLIPQTNVAFISQPAITTTTSIPQTNATFILLTTNTTTSTTSIPQTNAAFILPTTNTTTPTTSIPQTTNVPVIDTFEFQQNPNSFTNVNGANQEEYLIMNNSESYPNVSWVPSTNEPTSDEINPQLLCDDNDSMTYSFATSLSSGISNETSNDVSSISQSNSTTNDLPISNYNSHWTNTHNNSLTTVTVSAQNVLDSQGLEMESLNRFQISTNTFGQSGSSPTEWDDWDS